MKYMVMAAAAAACVIASAPATAATVAEYRFDGNGNDTSGNGLNATLMNGATYGAGRFGQALSLDGVNDYATVNFPNMTLSAFTLEAWINVPTYASNVHYISLNQGSNYLVLGDYGSGVISTWAGGLNPIMLEGGSAATTVNAWHHIAFTWDGGMERIYLDGALVGSAASTGTLSASENVGLKIGSRYTGQGQFVTGLIDNVRISNVALSGNQLGYFADGGNSAVPEPATWAMMMLGFGALGTAMRRRPALKVSARFA